MKCKECKGIGKWEYGPGLHEVEICKSCKGTGETMRDEVQWFADQMELTLRKNDHKGGWSDCQWEYLINRLHEEYHELRASLEAGDASVKTIQGAADVANFAMMIADIARKSLVLEATP